MTATAKFPTVTKFCGYFELKTGGLIIGWLDVTIYVLVILYVILKRVAKDIDEEREKVKDSTIVGIYENFVLRLFIPAVLLAFAGLFVKGICDNQPKKCFPYVVLHGLTVMAILLAGLVLVNAYLIIIAAFKAYFFVVIYSVYKSMSYEGGKTAFEAHANAGGAGYEQFYEPEGYNANAEGYQTTDFQGP